MKARFKGRKERSKERKERSKARFKVRKGMKGPSRCPTEVREGPSQEKEGEEGSKNMNQGRMVQGKEGREKKD